jgi:hypothetical protein
VIDRPISYLAALLLTSGSVSVLADLSVGSWLSQVNTVLLTLGGSCILLYQRKLQADRDRAYAADQLVSSTAFNEVKARLEAVIVQRDHEQHRADQLFEQMTRLAELHELHRCVFPGPDGSARCMGREPPPS